jgi:protein TonB
VSVALKEIPSEDVDQTAPNVAPYPVPGRTTRVGDVSLLSALSLSLGLHIVPAVLVVGAYYLYGPSSTPPPGEVLVYSVSIESPISESTAPSAKTEDVPAPQRPQPQQPQKIKAPTLSITQRTKRTSETRAFSTHAAQPLDSNTVELPAASSNSPAALAPSANAIASQSTEARISYQQLVTSLLSRAKRYPERARRRGETGTGTIRLQLDAQGEVVASSVISSTGSETLDDELNALVDRAAPFPPFPQGLTAQTLTFTVPVSFRLQP